jgi:hypothetical protein
MYVVPSDGMDRSFDVNDTIVNSTAAWQSWLSDQTGGRRIRLDTYFGQPDITFALCWRSAQSEPASESRSAAGGVDRPLIRPTTK